jgi:hypothetical protein
VLDQLLSEAGIDHRVTRKDFRAALEQGCGICVPFYEEISSSSYDHYGAEPQDFWVLDDQDPNLDDQELVINFTAKISSKGGPYNVQGLAVDAFSGNERGNIYNRFYLYTDHGNMLSFGLVSFEPCSD